MNNSNVNKLFTPLLDSIYAPDKGENKQKVHEVGELTKAGLWQMKQDIENGEPGIKFTTECEAIYLRAFIMGAIKGAEHVSGIYNAPTLERNGILDNNNHEAIN